MTTYCADGANMDPVHMGERSPGSVRLGLAVRRCLERVIAVRLPPGR